MKNLKEALVEHFTRIISETNGISLKDTLDLSIQSEYTENELVKKTITEFRKLLSGYEQDEVEINTLLVHPVSDALKVFFKSFPLPYKEEHIHLTGSLTADFIYPRLKKLLKGPNKAKYIEKINLTYDSKADIKSIKDVDNLIRLKDDEEFDRYLQILLLAKFILIDRKSHEEAAYHMASELYNNYNVGSIRLKFTFSRATTNSFEQIPGIENVSEEDVVMGLYTGFKKFQKECTHFKFTLSPCFRKEADFYDGENFPSKKEHFKDQVNKILQLIEKYPELENVMTDVDTVGNERSLYRKSHFMEMQQGFRKLHYRGFSIRSHHGETWYTLKKGVQAVDNAMNIWHIDTLEHGLSLGINPNYYFHSLYQRVCQKNALGIPVKPGSTHFNELEDMDWREHIGIKEKLFSGISLTEEEKIHFVKTKFHTAREVEHYQHDVLNRMIHKNVAVIALPSSNKKLTGFFPDFKDHPFSWWEKKGVSLGIGTDNYITLNTDYLRELLILLYTDADNLKITKLLMVATGETRRPYISQLLWKMRNQFDLKY